MIDGEFVAYKDLLVWQNSMVLANQVIRTIEKMDSPRKQFRLIEQLESAVTSIPLNIDEGKGRALKKGFFLFLYIARGSAYETLTLLEIFQQQDWLSQESFSNLE